MKKTFIMIIAMLLAAALLYGCGGEGGSSDSGEASGNGERLALAKDNATEFVIADFFENEDSAREIVTALAIKTGASFKVAKPAEDGKAIYVGTAGSLGGKGGTSKSLTYSQYELRIDGGNLYVVLGTENTVSELAVILRNTIEKFDDGSFGVSSESCGIKNICDISEVVPVFTTESGEMLELHDCGSNHYEAVYTGMDKSGADAEIAAYEQKLLESGYTLFQENNIGNNRFTTFTKGDTEVHCNYFYAAHEYRIVYGKLGYLGPEAPVTDFKKVTEATISEIGMSESVQCNVIQFVDGSFVIIDGGWGSDASKTYSYINDKGEKAELEYQRDYKADMDALWSFLQKKTPAGDRPQVTWMITHADPDHICLFPPFLAEHAADFDLNTIVYNFPNMFNIGLGNGSSTNDPGTMQGYVDNFFEAAEKYYPNVNHYVYHTGQKLYLPGCELEFLFTQEDYWPGEMAWMNATSGAWRFTFADSGKTALFLGDCEVGMNNKMAQFFGEYMKSDIFQPAHHGSNGGTLALYKLVDPEVCFWTCADFPFYNDNRHTGTKEGWDFNKFLRESSKVKYHFTNSETHTLVVATMEEEK